MYKQLWRLIPAKDGYMAIYCYYTRVLDVPGGSTDKWVGVNLSDNYSGGNNQQWQLVLIAGDIDDDTHYNRWYIIAPRSGIDKGLVLDVPDASPKAGIQIQQYTFHGGHNQQWFLNSIEVS